MVKLNRSIETMLEYLRRKVPFINSLFLTFEKENNSDFYLTSSQYYRIHKVQPIEQFKAHYLAPLQHFLDIGKDFIDTFKPYKGGYQAKRELMQPLIGLNNILKGSINLLLTPLILFANLFLALPYDVIMSTYYGGSAELISKGFKNNLIINLSRSISWLLEGGSSLLRGITQIATTPLTLILKIPLRGILTVILGAPKIEDNQFIQDLVAKGNNVLDENYPGYINCLYNGAEHMDLIANTIHSKYIKGLKNCQKTDISPAEEKEKHATNSRRSYNEFSFYTSFYGSSIVMEQMSDRKIQHARTYLGLFSHKKTSGLSSHINEFDNQSNSI